ncbi:MAG TPA: spore germination protein GerW family protein [Chryseolinea sp.]|nr:spore germination protein GerW family protein [Chryseolinea sp.]
MEMNFENLLQKLTEFLQKEAKTETVIGESFKLGDFTCVPVVRIGVGFGSGGGSGDAQKTGKGEGGGAAAGLGIDPIGFLVTKGDQISFVTTHQNKGLSAVFEKVPELIEKMMAKKKEPAEV